LTRTSSHTSEPSFDAERNFAILRSDAHVLHISVHAIVRKKYGVLRRKPVASASIDLSQYAQHTQAALDPRKTGAKLGEVVTLPLVDFETASALILADPSAVKALQQDAVVGSILIKVCAAIKWSCLALNGKDMPFAT
jgi:hypothetical protein